MKSTIFYGVALDIIIYRSTVAVGMVGCRQSRLNFMRGYNVMLEKIEPEKIICVGEPFPEMDGKVVVFDYYYNGKAV